MSFVNLVIISAVAAAVPLLLGLVPRLPVPGPVVEIVAGIVLGPSLLGWVEIDGTVEVASTLGLAFLLFLAGLEIDVTRFAGALGRRSALGFVVSVAIAVAAGQGLQAAGLADDGLLIAVALSATALGLVVPVVIEAGAADRAAGQITIAGASLSEVGAIVLLSLLFSTQGNSVGARAVLLGLLALLAVLLVVAASRAGTSMRATAFIDRLADTTAQIRVRLAVLLLVGLAAVAGRLGFEAILGAFIAGVVLRLIDHDAQRTHPHFHLKLDGIGFGFLVPVFFVASGVAFDLDALREEPAALALVPLYLLLLLGVRGLPAFVHATTLTRREIAAVAFLQATSLPFIVAATEIGLRLDLIRESNAAALVAAGLVSVLLFPAIATRLLTPSPVSPHADRKDPS